MVGRLGKACGLSPDKSSEEETLNTLKFLKMSRKVDRGTIEDFWEDDGIAYAKITPGLRTSKQRKRVLIALIELRTI